MCESLACWECVFGLVYFENCSHTRTTWSTQFIWWKTKRIKKKWEAKKNAIDENANQHNFVCETQKGKKIYTLYHHAHVTLVLCGKAALRTKCADEWRVEKRKVCIHHGSVPFLHSISFSETIKKFMVPKKEERKKWTWTRCIRWNSKGYFLSCFCQHAKKKLSCPTTLKSIYGHFFSLVLKC